MTSHQKAGRHRHEDVAKKAMRRLPLCDARQVSQHPPVICWFYSVCERRVLSCIDRTPFGIESRYRPTEGRIASAQVSFRRKNSIREYLKFPENLDGNIRKHLCRGWSFPFCIPFFSPQRRGRLHLMPNAGSAGNFSWQFFGRHIKQWLPSEPLSLPCFRQSAAEPGKADPHYSGARLIGLCQQT